MLRRCLLVCNMYRNTIILQSLNLSSSNWEHIFFGPKISRKTYTVSKNCPKKEEGMVRFHSSTNSSCTKVQRIYDPNLPCLKSALSKGLGLGIVAGSLLVKLPQIIKILANKSAEGLSFLSVILELYAVTSGVAYSYAKGFTFSAWGDALFLLIQTALIALLVLHYNYSSNVAAGFVAVFSAVLYVLVGGFTPVNILWSMQAFSVPIMFAGKMVQAYTNYRNGSTGQLSAMTCVMLLFGSTARIFTSIQETGDTVIIITYALATLGNAILVSQFVYYGYSQPKAAARSKKAKKNAAKKAQ